MPAELPLQRCEQAHMVRERYWRSTALGCLIVLVMGALLAEAVPWPQLLLWCAACLCWQIAGQAVCVQMQPEPTYARMASRQLRAIAMWNGSYSLMLCTGLFSFQPQFQPEHQVLLHCLPIAVTIQAMIAFSVHLPTILLMLVPVMLSNIAFQWPLASSGAPGFFLMSLLLSAMLLQRIVQYSRQARAALAGRLQGLQLLRDLRAQSQHAEAMATAKTRFVYAASHDLRQPMHSLTMYLDVLSDMKPDAPRRADVLERAGVCSATLNQLFSSLMEIARLDGGTVKPDIAPFRLAPLLNEMRLEFHVPSQKRQQPLKIVPCRLQAHGDPALVQQILHKLIDNALLHASHGRVLVTCRRRGDTIRISVQDNGIGIPHQHQQQVFDEFFQLDNPERDRSKGLGLGLAVAQRYAQLLGSRITLRSIPGKGSCFSFDLPLAGAEPFAARPPLGGPGTADVPLVLVIDDDPFALDIMAELLSDYGYVVVAANGSAEAISKLASSRRAPDMILSDFHLIGESAHDVITAVCDEFNQAIPALIVTGDRQVRDIDSRGIQVLQKPIAASTLQSAVQQLLSTYLPA